MVAARILFSARVDRAAPGDPAICRTPAGRDLRAEWGCDRDREPWMKLPCVACTERTQEHCKECGGDGKFKATRCRCHYLTPDNQFVCHTLSMLEVGIGPFSEAPGWGDWPAPFVRALALASRARAEATAESTGGGS